MSLKLTLDFLQLFTLTFTELEPWVFDTGNRCAGTARFACGALRTAFGLGHNHGLLVATPGAGGTSMHVTLYVVGHAQMA